MTTKLLPQRSNSWNTLFAMGRASHCFNFNISIASNNQGTHSLCYIYHRHVASYSMHTVRHPTNPATLLEPVSFIHSLPACKVCLLSFNKLFWLLGQSKWTGRRQLFNYPAFESWETNNKYWKIITIMNKTAVFETHRSVYYTDLFTGDFRSCS